MRAPVTPGSDPPAPDLDAGAQPLAAGARVSLDPLALADFLESLAHDLRSPLGVVSGALTELGAEIGDRPGDDRLILTLADRSVRRLGRIADTLSLAATLDGGTFELRRATVDLVALVRAAAATAASIGPRREVEVVAALPAAPIPAFADGRHLERAVAEVVINAVRHARRLVRLGLEVADGAAQVVIEDDGEGVAEARLATLFRRFTPRSSRSGLGIGLSLAHDLVAAHGGRITLEASTLPPGRPATVGARVVMAIPLEDPR